MKPRRFFNVLLLLPAMLGAQGPADPVAVLTIAAPRNYVLAGSGLSLRATATTALGSFVANPNPRWRTLNAEVAVVDAQGTVSGQRPGIAPIEASLDGATETFVVRVYPTRIEILPRSLDLEPGQRATLQVRAIDVAGRPIPDVRFRWSAGLSGVATVDQAGAVTAVNEGSTSITAALDAGAPGFHFSSQTTVNVRRRGSFRLTTLVSNENVTRPVQLRYIQYARYAGADRIAVVGTLSNGSVALLSYENGTWRVLAITGQHLAGRTLHRFESIFINSQGDILAYVNRFNEGETALLFRGGAVTPVSLSGSQCCFNVAGFSDTGDLFYTTWNGQSNDFFQKKAGGAQQKIASSGDSIPGFGVFDWVGESAGGPGGATVFRVGRHTNPVQALVRWDGQKFTKIFATNDAVLGTTIRGFDTPVVTANGDVVVRQWGDNFSRIARLRGSAWTQLAPKPQPAEGEINIWHIHQFYNASNDSAIWMGDSDQGHGVFRARGSAVEKVANGGDWLMFQQAFLRPSGDVIVIGAQGSSVSRLSAVAAGGSQSLLEAGRSFDVPAPVSLDWRNLGGNLVAGSPLVRSSSGMLVKANRGSVESVLGPGDAVDAQSRIFFGVNWEARNQRGDILFAASTSNGFGLFAYRDGRTTNLLWDGRTFRLADGRDIQVHCCFSPPAAYNNRGQAVFQANTSMGDGLVMLDTNGAVRIVALRNQPLPGGGTMHNSQQTAIDENGRVLFQVNLNDGTQAYYLWENGQTRRLFKNGDVSPLGGPVVNNAGPIIGAGDRFYMMLALQDGAALVTFDGARWEKLSATGDAIAGGVLGG
ncbi:MAG: Ig-like domain-containing protein, partial [Bryobacteraceae bacterium]